MQSHANAKQQRAQGKQASRAALSSHVSKRAELRCLHMKARDLSCVVFTGKHACRAAVSSHESERARRRKRAELRVLKKESEPSYVIKKASELKKASEPSCVVLRLSMRKDEYCPHTVTPVTPVTSLRSSSSSVCWKARFTSAATPCTSHSSNRC